SSRKNHALSASNTRPRNSTELLPRPHPPRRWSARLIRSPEPNVTKPTGCAPPLATSGHSFHRLPRAVSLSARRWSALALGEPRSSSPERRYFSKRSSGSSILHSFTALLAFVMG